MGTNVQEFIESLDIGIFEKKLSKALSEVAAAVVAHDRPGKVSITFDIKPLGSGAQVMVNHKLAFTQPRSKGNITEDNTTNTPMYVGKMGDMTIMPDNQTKMFDDTNISKLGAK